MKHAFSLLLLPLLLVACGGDEESTDVAKTDGAGDKAKVEATSTPTAGKRYGVKSGVVESTLDFMGDQKIVTYFDDYGAKEATYTTISMMGTTSTSVSIVADGFKTEYDVEKKEGKRTPYLMAGSAMPDLATLTDAMKKEYEYKELGTKNYLGKEATGISMNMMGMKMVIYHWQNLPLYSEIYMGGDKPMIMEATKIETDVPVPADKFAVPADVKVTEYDAAGKPVAQ